MPRLAPRAWNPSLCHGFQVSGQAARWAQSMGCTLVHPPSAPGPLYPSPGSVQGSGDPRHGGAGTAERPASHRLGPVPRTHPAQARGAGSTRAPLHEVSGARWREQSEATREKLLFMTISSLTQQWRHPPQVGAQPLREERLYWRDPRGLSCVRAGPPAPATTPGPPSIPAQAPTNTRPLPFRAPPRRCPARGTRSERGSVLKPVPRDRRAAGSTAGAQRPALPGIPPAPAPAPPRSPSPRPVSAGTCRAPDVSRSRPGAPRRRAHEGALSLRGPRCPAHLPSRGPGRYAAHHALAAARRPLLLHSSSPGPPPAEASPTLANGSAE